MKESRMAKVSIVVRTKNRLSFLKRALADVAAQTFSDWDLLIINDAGDKAALDELYAGLDATLRAKITVWHLSVNIGRSAAAQYGLDAVTGEYLALHDDDDTWHPDFLQRCTRFLDSTPELAAVMARTEVVHEEPDGEGGWQESRREILTPEIHDMSLLELLVINKAVPIGCLYRINALRAIGGFDTTLPVVEDWELHLRLARQQPLGFIDGEPLAFWHQCKQAEGEQGNSMQTLADAHWIYDRRVRDAAMRDTLCQAPHLLGLALQSGLHMRKTHEYATALHEHLEYMRGEMRHLLHENLRKYDALQAQLEQLVQISSTLTTLHEEMHREQWKSSPLSATSNGYSVSGNADNVVCLLVSVSLLIPQSIGKCGMSCWKRITVQAGLKPALLLKKRGKAALLFCPEPCYQPA